MKRDDLVKEEIHKVFKREMFQENKVYKLINEETGLELFTGILILWHPEKIKFVVPSSSYFVRNFSTLVEERINSSLAIIAFSPSFLEDRDTLELLK
jgi:hypothetical protein